MNHIATIRHFFGSTGPAFALDEIKRVPKGQNGAGQFAKGSGGSGSSSAPKKESKPKKAKAEGSATPAKPRPAPNVSEQAHAAAKAKVAENAAKPKKPAKAKTPKAEKPAPAPKEKAPAKPKKPTQEERVAKLGEQYTNAMGAKPTRRRGGAESPVVPTVAETPAPKAEAKPAKAKSKKQIAEEKRRAEFNEEYAKMMAAVPQQETPSSHDVGHRVSFTVPAIVGNGKAIRATRGGIVQSIDDKGRLRVLDQTGSFHTLDPSEITSTLGPVPGEKERIQRIQRMNAPPPAKKPASKKATTEAKAPKPKAPKKPTVAPNLGEAFTAKSSRRRGGSNPDHAS